MTDQEKRKWEKVLLFVRRASRRNPGVRVSKYNNYGSPAVCNGELLVEHFPGLDPGLERKEISPEKYLLLLSRYLKNGETCRKGKRYV